ncbi:hypothetical protein STEG23_034763, partial [Scotinomys teguina]
PALFLHDGQRLETQVALKGHSGNVLGFLVQRTEEAHTKSHLTQDFTQNRNENNNGYTTSQLQTLSTC